MCGRYCDLRREPGFPFTSLGLHCARSHHLRCGLPEKPESLQRYAWLPSLLWWSGTDCGRVELHARFQWRSESASIPRCGPWMFTRRHGPRAGATFRAVLPGTRVHHAGSGRGNRDHRCLAWNPSGAALQRSRVIGGNAHIKTERRSPVFRN